jgi:hypothetical protein
MGPVREALARASDAIARGHSVQIVCFREDIRDLLKPIEESVELVRLPEGLCTCLGRPIETFRSLLAFTRLVYKLWGRVSGGQVWAYGTSISLSAIWATGFLAKQNTVFYNGIYEGRGAKDGIFNDPTKSVIRKLKGYLFGKLVGLPLNVCRDWSPVFVLDHSYIHHYFFQSPPWSRESRSSLEASLRKRSTASVLILFTNQNDYYRSSPLDATQIEGVWSELGALLHVYNNQQDIQIKPHPSCYNVPPSLSWIPTLQPGYSIEFFNFPDLKLVIGDASMAMQEFSQQANVTVISIAGLYKTQWAPVVMDYLHTRVDPHGLCLAPASTTELANILEKALAPRL